MSKIKKRTFSLPRDLSDFIDEKVKSGNYANSSEVVRAGLRALLERDESIPRKKLISKLGKGKQGQPNDHPIEELFDEIRARRGTS